MMNERTGLTHGRTIRKTSHRRSATDRYGRQRRNEVKRTSSRASMKLREFILMETEGV